MPIKSYASICVEGGDQVGKADAALTLHKELKRKGINVTYCSFPIYSTPIGTTIRCLLKEGCPKNVLNPDNDLEIRLTLYVLNRLEFLDVYLSDEKYIDTVLLLDRSPFSNAVTIGYKIESFDEKQVKEYVKLALNYDRLLISKLGLDRCIVQLKSKAKEWKNIREQEGDQLERKDVQEKCELVYDVYKNIIGDSWHQIITKDKNGWRDRKDILNDICNILKQTYGNFEDIQKGQRFSIGFKEVVDKMYLNSTYSEDVFSKYYLALKENNKDTMYANGVILGKTVADSCKNIHFSNKEVKAEFKRIIEKLPEILNVLEYFLGKNYTTNLAKSLGI